ncbi:MAG: hypothetical protein ACPGVB_04080 [Chitinophagales bacterium]
MWKRFKNSKFYIRWSSWEYYPAYLTNIPVVFFWLYFSIKAKSLFFFSAANPAIETGGVLGESKMKIIDQIPEKHKPTTVFVAQQTSFEQVLKWVKTACLTFPVIAKPNVGERGFLVEKLVSMEELQQYHQKNQLDFLIQEFVSYPVEVAILHYRYPYQSQGTISSICIKEFLNVEGDGESTVLQLMEKKPRAKLQIERLSPILMEKGLLNTIPSKGKKMELSAIGNHSKGAKFLNGNDLIDDELRKVFDQISLQLKGIHFCRYDLKCQSIADLKRGKNFKILEINGVAAEPAHIYDPNYSVLQAYKDLFQQWKVIYEISYYQHRNGVEYMTFGEAKKAVKEYLAYMKKAEKVR